MSCVTVDPAALRETLGAFPSGVTVVTGLDAGRPVGLTVSSFTSVSLDPPLALVCISRRSQGAGRGRGPRAAAPVPPTLAAFGIGAPIVVNVLAADQRHLAEHFASRIPDRFAGVATEPAGTASGSSAAPRLTGAAAWVAGEVFQLHEAGDHMVVVLSVTDLRRAARNPLLYHSGGFHEWMADPQ